jgi:hypothetical protein
VRRSALAGAHETRNPRGGQRASRDVIGVMFHAPWTTPPPTRGRPTPSDPGAELSAAYRGGVDRDGATSGAASDGAGPRPEAVRPRARFLPASSPGRSVQDGYELELSQPWRAVMLTKTRRGRDRHDGPGWRPLVGVWVAAWRRCLLQDWDDPRKNRGWTTEEIRKRGGSVDTWLLPSATTDTCKEHRLRHSACLISRALELGSEDSLIRLRLGWLEHARNAKQVLLMLVVVLGA